jgi:hypothetical protein
MNTDPFPPDDPFLPGRDAQHETCELCWQMHRSDFRCDDDPWTMADVVLWAVTIALVALAAYGATR